MKMSRTDAETVRLLMSLQRDGAPVRWEQSVVNKTFMPSEKRWYWSWIEIEWLSLDYAADGLGHMLADFYADQADIDDDGDIMIDSLWSKAEEAIRPEQTYAPNPEGGRWWEEVKDAFTSVMQEISDEWRADRKYGHPSLTAAERNPGLARGYW